MRKFKRQLNRMSRSPKFNPGVAERRVLAAMTTLFAMFVLGLGAFNIAQITAKAETETITRGVITDITNLPEGKLDGTTEADVGTEENPLVILEVVPYEEYAEIGYMISGCEPVDLTQLSIEQVITVSGRVSATNNPYSTYSICYSGILFFSDEPEASAGADVIGYAYACQDNSYTWDYTGQWSSTSTTLNGYYEVVEAGEGIFNLENGTLVKATTNAQQATANIIWHTINDAEADACGYDYTYTDSLTALVEVGDRCYTTRALQGETGIGYWYGIYFKNNDAFLYNTIGLTTQEEVDEYCVVVKTITPDELNDNTAWVDVADLIYIHDSSANGNADLVNYYKQVNGTNGAGTGSSVLFEGDFDLSWEVVLKIYNKVTADDDEDYAALIMPYSTYTNLSSGKSAISGVTFNIMNWNLEESGYTYSDAPGSCANLYKLAVMLYSMDSDLFKSLYLSGDEPVIQDGVDTIQTDSTAANYWTMYTFLLTDSEGNFGEQGNAYGYWCNQWDTYQTVGNIAQYNSYANGRVYTYDNLSLVAYLTVIRDLSNTRYTDFEEYLEENGLDYTSASALAYALGIGKTSSSAKLNLGTLNILDIEPVYGSDGLLEDENAGWSLTESYIRLMIPSLSASTEIVITHMTTAEFIGRSEDLNSTYDMIYIGDQIDGFNTKTATITYNTLSGGTTTVWNATITDFNDDTMDGLIYYHTGDLFYIYTRTGRNYNNVTTYSDGTAKNGLSESGEVDYTETANNSTVRLAGNDITSLKLAELEDFLAAGYPIITANYLYTLSTSVLDSSSYMYQLISENKGSSPIYAVGNTAEIKAALEAASPSVTFTTLPNKYNGETTEDGSIDVANANYLSKNSSGQSLMNFVFTITDSKENTYGYDIYVDQNQDGKFSDDEVYLSVSSVSTKGGSATISKTVKLSALYMGVVNWEIVVYRTDNTSIRFVEKGISASEASDEAIALLGEKTVINVLQIIPAGVTDSAKVLDLSTCELFTKYTENLNDYEINLTVMDDVEYEELFMVDNGDGTYSAAFTCESYTDTENITINKDLKKDLYEAYDMIIIGFSDSFGGADIDNDYGAVDFLYYWIAKGKGILFTHDLASLNTSEGYAGYNIASLLRDVMGMNRYGVVYSSLDETSQSKLIDYQATNSSYYDALTLSTGGVSSDIQGLSYLAAKILAVMSGAPKNGTVMPYRYLFTNSLGEIPYDLSTYGYAAMCTTVEETTKVTNVNTGEITSYPYEINGDLTVAKTHAQYYQLNMEDPEVTVWYCLANDGVNTIVDYYNGLNQSTGQYGTGAFYGVSPNDVTNNYYIYSKGNIFYSGVGHSGASISDDEMKLLINTMIAAYRTTYQAPVVEIDNAEATLVDSEYTDNLQYTIQAYMELDASTNTVSILPDATTQTVYFTPSELNVATTEITLEIYYLNEDGTINTELGYIDTIYDADTGKALTPTASTTKEVTVTYMDLETGEEVKTTVNTTVYTFDVTQNHEYYLEYPLSNVEEGNTTIQFRVQNNKCDDYGYTTLTFEEQMLLMLD